jgi:hypothetical protein
MAKEYDIMERGDIHFYIRPHLKTSDINSTDDLEHFLFVLVNPGTKKSRVFIVPKKSLPSTVEKEMYFAYVDKVTDNPKRIAEIVQGSHYSTEKQHDAILAPAQNLVTGKYFIISYKNQGHLVFNLNNRKKHSAIQDMLIPNNYGNYILSAIHPTHPMGFSGGLPLEKKAHLPKQVMQKFGNHKMISIDSPQLLDYEGSEFFLIGAGADSDGFLTNIKDHFATLPYNDLMKSLEQENTLNPPQELIQPLWK